MSKRCKTWFWMVLVFYCVLFFSGLVNNLIHGTLSSMFWANAVIILSLLIGVAILLFFQKRTGFFLICTIQAMAYLINVFLLGNSVFSCMLQFIPLPLITWYFLKTDQSWQALS